MYITGNVPKLGGWDLANALKLKWSPGHVWRGTIKLPSRLMNSVVEFKVGGFTMVVKVGMARENCKHVIWGLSGRPMKCCAMRCAVKPGKLDNH